MNAYYQSNGEQADLIEVPYGDHGDAILIYSFPDNSSFFLLGLGTPQEIIRLSEKWDKHLLENNIHPNTDAGRGSIIRTCRRAYPLSMLDDKDFWVAMEKDIRSNFHLSKEEMDIVSNSLSFPIFINGRAGSGKSTVLQYLFAEYLLRFLVHSTVAPPLYLSYSTNLIENAKDLSRSLFDKNSFYLRKLKEINKGLEDIEPHFQDTFYVFQELIRQFIGEKNKETLVYRFARGEKYVNYSKFRRMWMSKFGADPRAKNKYGPAISWHVIRSYIKGWNCEDFCEPEQYNNIGIKNRTVSEETFALVFQKVWEEWYQPECEKQRYWDDQDLVRYCLMPDDDSVETCVEPRFSAVFCDESQDFTRVELEFILRSSIFSHRKIYDESQIRKLPFVFAGDEFQTLNPTGFSWTTLRSYFTERLIHSTEFKTQHGAPKPIPLTKNYRSTEPIVKLANRLQLLRQTRFGEETDILPQSPNFADQYAEPVYCLSPNDGEVWEKLKEVQAVLIVPCDDGQTAKDYIENSPISEYIEFYDDGTPVGITIYNPSQAKGLEYNVVAVYGFGDNEDFKPSKLKRFFSGNGPLSNDQEIDQKYFLNNAYVSVTRAQRQLFIIDKMVEKEKSFWDFAFSDPRTQKDVEEIESQMLACVNNREKWLPEEGRSVLGLIVSGSISNLTGDAVITDPIENARKNEEQGRSLQDSDIMRMAAARYRERSKKEDALRCEAFAEQFDENYMQAGEKFKEAKLFDDAIRCFWLAGAQIAERSVAMKSLANLRRNRDSAIEVQVASHYQKNQPDIGEVSKMLNTVYGILSGDDMKMRNDIYDSTIQWQDILNTLLKRIPTTSTNSKMRIILDLCNKLADRELPLDLDFQAEWLYQLGEKEKAIGLWDKLDSSDRPTQNENYYKAKVETMLFPDNLKYWTYIPNWEKNVIAEYRKSPQTVLTPEQYHVVARAALKYGTKEEIRKFLPDLLFDNTNLTNILDILGTASGHDKTIPKSFIEVLLRCKLRESVPEKLLNELRQTQQAVELLQLVKGLAEVRSQGFLDYLNRSFRQENKKVIDVMNEKFRKYSRTVWNQPLFFELGAIFEKRGHFLDALRFYQWAEDQTDDPVFKRELGLRWIACKERQADHDDSEKYWNEAREKRNELNCHSDLPLEPVFVRWYLLLERVMSISVIDRNEDVVIHEHIDTGARIEPDDNPKLQPMSSRATKAEKLNRYFRTDYFGYKFCFNPAIFELSITLQTESENLSTKIKDGHFPDNSDFVMRETQLLKSSGEPTPFSVKESESGIIFIHDESGIQLCFFR